MLRIGLVVQDLELLSQKDQGMALFLRRGWGLGMRLLLYFINAAGIQTTTFHCTCMFPIPNRLHWRHLLVKKPMSDQMLV